MDENMLNIKQTITLLHRQLTSLSELSLVFLLDEELDELEERWALDDCGLGVDRRLLELDELELELELELDREWRLACPSEDEPVMNII